MRLHFLIFASIAGAPVAALTTSAKTASFADELGIAQSQLTHTQNYPAAVAGASVVSRADIDGLRERGRLVLAQVGVLWP